MESLYPAVFDVNPYPMWPASHDADLQPPLERSRASVGEPGAATHRLNAPPPPLAPERHGLPRHDDDGGVRIVLVDDHARYLRQASRFVERHQGLQVVGTATTAAEALEAARRLQPDLILLDISMPGGSGLDAILQLKALDPPPLVIVVSMKDPGVYGAHALSLGADAFVHKGRMVDELVPAIERVTGRGG